MDADGGRGIAPGDLVVHDHRDVRAEQPSPRVPDIRPPLRRSVRRGAKLAVRYRACRASRLSLRIWRAGGTSRRPAIRRTVKIRRKLRGTVTFRSSRLAAGRYRLSARFGTARPRTWTMRVRPRAGR